MVEVSRPQDSSDAALDGEGRGADARACVVEPEVSMALADGVD